MNKINSKAWFILSLVFYLMIPTSFSQNSERPDKNSFIPPITTKEQSSSVPQVVIDAKLNKYFELKKVQPDAAKAFLTQILNEDPKNVIANKEMAYLLLNNNKLEEAMNYFYKVLQIDPNDQAIVKEVGVIQERLINQGKDEANVADKQQTPPIEKPVPTLEVVQLLNEFYQIKDSDPNKAKTILQQIVIKYPENIRAQREFAFAVLKEKNYELALKHLLIAEKLTPNDNDLKIQIGYVYLSLKEPEKANAYFKIAAKTTDPFLQKKALQGIVEIKTSTVGSNLSGSELLLNQYYQLNKTQPKQARNVLEKLVNEYPDNIIGQRELAFTALKEKNYAFTLKQLLIVEKLTPHDDDLKMQIGYVYLSLKKPEKALSYFQEAAKTTNSVLRLKATQAIASFKASQQAAPTIKRTEAEQWLDQFYALNKTNPKAARQILQRLVNKYPTNLIAQREIAFSLVKDKNYKEALQHFLIIERLTPNDYDIKMQIGYLLNNLERPAKAYSYFSKATKSSNPELKLKANEAMTNMSGMQTKFLPNPWFADIYLYPLYYSRFVMTIYPGIGRVGRAFGEKKQWEAYVINRTVWDNRSGKNSGLNALPQIFEDDASVTSFGIRHTLFYKSSIPALRGLKLYGEVGKAYDLIRKDPNRRWRNDFRGGLLYWYGWGAGHEYTNKLRFPMKHIGSFYMDVSYFTRYNDNIIGYYSLKEGVRALNFQTAEINIFARVRGGFDKNREFFNNFVEVGPAIEIIPNNRYNFAIRFEHLKGYYIPVNNSQSVNPYGPSYTNNLTIAELYMLF